MKHQRRTRWSTIVPAAIEHLEDRILLFSLVGSEWGDTDITYSLMPDGTQIITGEVSEMFFEFDTNTAPTEVWQAEIERAMQTWAAAADITITLVADDGSPQGIEGSAQGDSRFGDLRFGVHTMAPLGYGWFPSSSTTGGDIALTTEYTFHIGSPIDLYSVALHEIGHALGLRHSDVSDAVMNGTGFNVWDGLHADDIAGIQAIYGAPNGDWTPPDDPLPPDDGSELAEDRFEPNDSLSSALDFGRIRKISEDDLTIHSSTDSDFFQFSTPRKGGTFNISITFAHSAGDLDLTVYDAQGNVLAESTSTTDNESITLSLAGGQQYYVVVGSLSGDINEYDLSITIINGKGKSKSKELNSVDELMANPTVLAGLLLGPDVEEG